MNRHHTVTDTRPATPTGLQHAARRGYQLSLLLFLVLGVVQIFLAGFGAFKLNGGELGTATMEPHRQVGFAMGALALVILVLALVGRTGRRAITLSFVLALLAFMGQSLLADLGERTSFFGGLHALDGLIILGIAGFLHGQTRQQGPRETTTPEDRVRGPRQTFGRQTSGRQTSERPRQTSG